MKSKNRLLRLSLIVCLVLGWAAYLPTAPANVALAENPFLPIEQIERNTPAGLPTAPALSPQDAELHAALETLELARQ